MILVFEFTDRMLDYPAGGYSVSDSPRDQKNLLSAWLQAALFCEKVLKEADGVFSFIRVIDRFNLLGASKEIGTHLIRFTLVVVFKVGILRGKNTIRIRPISPTGKEMQSMEFPLLFEGDEDRGAGVIGEINFPVDEEGLYWLDVYLLDELITRMPLRVTYQQIGMTTAG
jgi:hypothetical protein